MSIVIPAHNDEEWISTSIQSCQNQSLTDLEIIVVDDASTDSTRSVVERFAQEDQRIQLISFEENQSAYQARRAGIQRAKAPYILFVDGDDELVSEAAQTALSKAAEDAADVVGFGVELVTGNGSNPTRFERELQPQHPELNGAEILPGLFPVEKVAQGHIWKYLWATDLLARAYDALPQDLQLFRANDIPIAMLGLSYAQKYVSLSDRLYRYYFRRGVSGLRLTDTQSFGFYLTALDSIDIIDGPIRERAASLEHSDQLLNAYESARLSTINVVLRYAVDMDDEGHQEECLGALITRVGAAEVLQAAAIFHPAALPTLAANKHLMIREPRLERRTIMLFTGNLGSGGVQGVVVSQARHLVEAGYRVIVALRTTEGIVHEVPEGVELREVAGASRGEKLQSFLEICRGDAVDYVIDHYILYNNDWPFFALAAQTLGVQSAGWLHNFALRPVFDFNRRTSFLTRYLPLLDRVVTLSAADVAFWKSRGIDQTVYLPNPASPWLFDRPARNHPRSRPLNKPLHIVWWGRIQEHTKRVKSLVDVAGQLQKLDVDFELSIIGPDSKDLTSEELREYSGELGVESRVHLPGAMHGAELMEALDGADMYVCTSAIEGYPLTLIEAQALGLPVAMYDLPWLAMAEGNDGIVTAPRGDARGLARTIASIATDTGVYRELSLGSLGAAETAMSHNFTELYAQLLAGTLPPEYSPALGQDLLNLLLDQALDFHEENVGRQGRYERRMKGNYQELKRDWRRLKSMALDLRAEVRGLKKEKQRLKQVALEARADARAQKKRVTELEVELDAWSSASVQKGTNDTTVETRAATSRRRS